MENPFGAGPRDTMGFVKDLPTCLATAGLLLPGSLCKSSPSTHLCSREKWCICVSSSSSYFGHLLTQTVKEG